MTSDGRAIDVLLIEDDAEVVAGLTARLELEGFHVGHLTEGAGAVEVDREASSAGTGAATR